MRVGDYIWDAIFISGILVATVAAGLLVEKKPAGALWSALLSAALLILTVGGVLVRG